MSRAAGVSFVVPVHNGEAWLERTLSAILAQTDGRPVEVIVVDDRSRDQSRRMLEPYATSGSIKVLDGEGRGAAAAINLGVRAAVHPLICQVDQDVILHPGWMSMLAAELEAADVAAAQGYYVAPAEGSVWSRVMGLDLEYRYSRIRRRRIDHICTGNTMFRASALLEAGLFDETLGYGYDNDISYRLVRAGHRLVICRHATSTHEWRNDLWGYCRQQYGFGYGRLDLVAKHHRRVTGDKVSPLDMMLHAPLMAVGVVALAAASILALAGFPVIWLPSLGAGLIGMLALDRAIAGLRAAAKFHDRAGFFFVPVHFVRDFAWTAAIGAWLVHRLRGRPSRLTYSMHPRDAKISLSPSEGTHPHPSAQ